MHSLARRARIGTLISWRRLNRQPASGLLIYKPDAQVREAPCALTFASGLYCHVIFAKTMKSTGS